MKNYIWLFGENEGKTKNNNSYYFWKHTLFRDKNIDKFFILIKNKKNLEFYNRLNDNVKKYIIWKNSIRHWQVYAEADMLFVSLSYKDVAPDKLLFKELKRVPHAPVVYLQHGTIAIKKLGYKGNGYNNNFFRFCVYNKKIIDIFSKENEFEPYQLYYAQYHPRYIEMIRRFDEFNSKPHDKKTILYFMTWREYFGNNASSRKFIKDLIKLVTNEKLIKYLKDGKYIFKLCVHQFFDNNGLDNVKKVMDKTVFKIVYPSKVNVMDELVSCEMLITDYSSVGFECTIMNKPVVLYTPDLNKYLKGREIYCTQKELEKYSINNVKDLIDTLINKKYKINKFFKSRLPDNIDFDYIRKGKHIDRMNDYFKEKCENKISFIGYRYGGSGGTVSATKSLVTGLMKKEYLVEMVSLKGTLKDKTEFPKGVNERRLSENSRNRYLKMYENLKYKVRVPNKLEYFNYDSRNKYMVSDLGTRLNRYLSNTKAHTIVSTTESVHPFLNDVKNSNIKNKVYFFHTDSSACDKIFPNLKPILSKINYDKCAFVTKNNYENYKKDCPLNIKKYSILGNCITEDTTIKIDKIKEIKPSKIYKAISLSRIAKDRKKDIDNIINYGKYLKDNKIKNIVVDVFGMGDYEKEFKKLIRKNKLSNIINFKGKTTTAHLDIRGHDLVVDFSNTQSFGMTYLEGILNGKPVFCTKNTGSKEVLKDLDYCFYENFDELTDKINNLDKITLEDLKHNYEVIYNRYSEETIANNFIELIEVNKR